MVSNAVFAVLLVAYVQFASAISIDSADYKFTAGLNTTVKGTNSYAQATEYGRTHPTRDGGSWSGWYVLDAFVV